MQHYFKYQSAKLTSRSQLLLLKLPAPQARPAGHATSAEATCSTRTHAPGQELQKDINARLWVAGPPSRASQVSGGSLQHICNNPNRAGIAAASCEGNLDEVQLLVSDHTIKHFSCLQELRGGCVNAGGVCPWCLCIATAAAAAHCTLMICCKAEGSLCRLFLSSKL